ncbi:DUF4349 domain-containing protein [Solirubrobacter phytolaccae]|uniref:DUF4349 domain-containing protein n=1 Tax=Solirubrobacter phytolaccae TaxID=1404360 RepID=A0A9X3N623_9ACTN|nr:DUF4349 domain-containing protein [Solirubrobacter phytolaccae]MDA0179100.1 DUF4349 domain-containing protein [Solirubrobacter phytolaccae]
MPDLETLLRETKPAPDPAWTLKLDSRVAHRFPNPPSRPRAALIRVGEHMVAIVASLAVAGVIGIVMIAGLSGTGGGDDEPASSASYTESTTSEDSGSGGSSSAPAAEATPEPLSTVSPTTSSPDEKRAVRASASLTLATTPDRVQGLTNRAITIVDQLDGYVQSSEIDQPSSRRAIANLSLRIPSAKLDDGLGRISKLANVQSRTQQTEDLTDQREAMEAAVRDARSDRDGLRNRLEKATTDKERQRLRALVNQATRRVTRRTREVNELGRDVSYATVDLEIRGTKSSGAAAPADDDGRWTAGDAVGDAVRVLEVVAGVLVIVLAIVLPIVAIGVLAWIAVRITTRRRRERALEGA